jgi:arsenite-transporting ATPase
MRIPERATRNLFFTGKGGVGKTATACATAVALADSGKAVLLVSTDPASNLDEVLATPLDRVPTPISGLARLHAVNVDPQAAAVAYRERVVGPYRALLPASAVASIEEQFSGACTVEIAAFDEFAKLIGDPTLTAMYDHVIFDTAPTGHTLRLLALPAAWTGFLGASAVGTSCLGPLQGMLEQKALYESAVAMLSDARQTTMVLVSRPDSAALEEAQRTSVELRGIGIGNQLLVLNGVFDAAPHADPVASAMRKSAARAIAEMPAALAALERTSVALKAAEVIGIDALRGFFTQAQPAASAARASTPRARLSGLDALVDGLECSGRGLIMTMGKGGVGKTTIAARIAVALARRGHPVHLTTTDPAAHVSRAIADMPSSLSIGEINPAIEVERYRAEVMATAGARLDASGLALLREDLASPCTEEVAVFQAFARTVDRATAQIVVVDTAPTGHTILLLDAAQSYHREVMRQARSVTDSVRNLLPRLRDPLFTRIVLCTLAEATPVHEAAALQADLRRAAIEPFAWVLNQALTPLHVTDPLLVARRDQEARYIDEVAFSQARRAYIVEWQAFPGTGIPHLRDHQAALA